MRLSNQRYNIDIKVDSTYILNSVDNKPYNIVLKLYEDIELENIKACSGYRPVAKKQLKF